MRDRDLNFPDPSEENRRQLSSSRALILAYTFERYLERQPEGQVPSDLLLFMSRAGFVNDAPVYVRGAQDSDLLEAESEVQVREPGFESGFRKLGNYVLDSLTGNRKVCAALCVVTSKLGMISMQMKRPAQTDEPAITFVSDELA